MKISVQEFDQGEIDVEDLFSKGWTYKDTAWTTYEVWDEFIQIVERNNIKILAQSKFPDRTRGQLLISPIGMQRLEDFAATKQ